MSFILVKRNNQEQFISNTDLRQRLLTNTDNGGFSKPNQIIGLDENWKNIFLQKIEYEYPRISVDDISSLIKASFKGNIDVMDRIFALERDHFITIGYLLIQGYISEAEVVEVVTQSYYNRTEALLDYLSRETASLDVFKGFQTIITDLTNSSYTKLTPYKVPNRFVTAKTGELNNIRSGLMKTWLYSFPTFDMLPPSVQDEGTVSWWIRKILSLIPITEVVNFALYGLVLHLVDFNLSHSIKTEDLLYKLINNEYSSIVYDEVTAGDIYSNNITSNVEKKSAKKYGFWSYSNFKNMTNFEKKLIRNVVYGEQAPPYEHSDMFKNIFKIYGMSSSLDPYNFNNLTVINTAGLTETGVNFESYSKYVKDSLDLILPNTIGGVPRSSDKYLYYMMTNNANIQTQYNSRLSTRRAYQKTINTTNYRNAWKHISDPGIQIEPDGTPTSMDIDVDFYFDFIATVRILMETEQIPHMTYDMLSRFTSEVEFKNYLKLTMLPAIMVEFRKTVSGSKNEVVNKTLELLIMDYFDYLTIQGKNTYSVSDTTKKFLKEVYKTLKVFKYIKELFNSYDVYVRNVLNSPLYSQLLGFTTNYPSIDTPTKALLNAGLKGSVFRFVPSLTGHITALRILKHRYSNIKNDSRWKENGRLIPDDQ